MVLSVHLVNIYLWGIVLQWWELVRELILGFWDTGTIWWKMRWCIIPTLNQLSSLINILLITLIIKAIPTYYVRWIVTLICRLSFKQKIFLDSTLNLWAHHLWQEHRRLSILSLSSMALWYIEFVLRLYLPGHEVSHWLVVLLWFFINACLWQF